MVHVFRNITQTKHKVQPCAMENTKEIWKNFGKNSLHKVPMAKMYSVCCSDCCKCLWGAIHGPEAENQKLPEEKQSVLGLINRGYADKSQFKVTTFLQ